MKVAYLKNWIEDRPLDLRYLGQKYSGNPRQREELLGYLKELVDEHGENWVKSSRGRLLKEAEYPVGINL